MQNLKGEFFMKSVLHFLLYFSLSLGILFFINCNDSNGSHRSGSTTGTISDETDETEVLEIQRKIVFYSCRDMYTQIYAVDEDGENLVNLSNSSTDDLAPEYSPTAGKIAYGSGLMDIMIMDADGSDKIQITNNGRYNVGPRWSPDEKSILFRSILLSNLQDRKLHIINIESLEEITLEISLERPASDYAWFPVYTWSPDGTEIAYALGSEIFIMNNDGTDISRIVDIDEIIRSLSWSPDGSKILINTYDIYPDGIYTINPDGTGLNKLSADESFNYIAAWSPDGNKIAYIADVDDYKGLFIMDKDGNNKQMVTSPVGYSIAWSPNGNKIAFTTSRDGDSEIYVIDINTSALINVTRCGDMDYSPSWH